MPFAKVALASLLLAVATIQSAHAQGQAGRAIVIEEPWARATPGGASTGAAYMTIVNKGGTADRLLSAATPVARDVQFHKVTEESGISRMRELKAIDIASGTSVLLKPGNIHIMLVGLKQPLKQGESFPLTLEFETAGRIDVRVATARVGATRPDSGKHH